MRVLVDTCVIVDELQDRKPFSDNAKTIFYAVANKQIDGYISAKSITDIYYIAHRATHSDENTRKILKTLLGLFDILDTAAIDCKKHCPLTLPIMKMPLCAKQPKGARWTAL